MKKTTRNNSILPKKLLKFTENKGNKSVESHDHQRFEETWHNKKIEIYTLYLFQLETHLRLWRWRKKAYSYIYKNWICIHKEGHFQAHINFNLNLFLTFNRLSKFCNILTCLFRFWKDTIQSLFFLENDRNILSKHFC